MTVDIPHAIATGLVIFAVIWLVEHASPFENLTKGRKTLITAVALFVLLFILNIVWPYSSANGAVVR